MIIDFHTHIVSPHIKQNRAEYLSDPVFNELYASPKARLATAEDLVASMDKDGVDLSVALNIGWSSPDRCAETNDYLMEAVNHHPGRLVAYGMVCLTQGIDAAVREVERCARGGLRGIGEMRLSRHLLEHDETRTLEYFATALTANSMTLLVHSSEPVGHDYPGKGDTGPDLLYGLAKRFPGVSMVFAHWGGGLPLYGLMPEVKQALAGVSFDTAASPYLYNPQIYREVVQILGVQSIVFGTDYPLLRASRGLKEIRSLALPAEVEESILSANALRVLGRTPPAETKVVVS
jgi:predicted TIM-barrel fold metal-dependent hydrolase